MNTDKNKFIKNIKVNFSQEVVEQQQSLENKLTQVIDTYLNYNTVENYTRLDYTVAGLYFALAKVLPEGVKFRIDYRTKSFRSTQKSTDLELLTSNYDKLTKDIFGIKIIITDIPKRLIIDTTNHEYDYEGVLDLENTRLNNITFIEETRKWINSTETDTLKTEDIFYEKMCETLKRIQESTYDDCTQEVEIPYNERFKQISDTYSKKKKEDNLSFTISKEQYNSLNLLIDDLENRLNDKLQLELLKFYLPIALDLNLMSNMLDVKYDFEKSKIVPNGYVADFFILYLGKNLKAELQTQSKYRYLVGTTGIGHHNGKHGKNINIFSLFELVDDKEGPDKLNYYLKVLNQMSIDTYTKAIIEGTYSKTIEQVADAYKHIKLKNKIYVSDATDSEPNNHYYDMDKYLMSFAQYVSANMLVCRSAHNFDMTTVTIEKKDLSDAFAEVLRKRDGISCLAQLLVDKVKSMMIMDPNFLSSYKTLSATDIFSYANTLNKDKDKSIDEK